jgi:hypothetical protein
MTRPLDFQTQTSALQIAQRLAAAGNGPEGLSLLRELIAGLVDSNQILAVIEAWIAAGSRSSRSSGVGAYYRKLPKIIETFAASGYAAEAARVMATGVGLYPDVSRSFVEAGRNSFGRTKPDTVSEGSIAAAQELAGVGMDILKAGNSEGIILLGAARSVMPQISMPVEDIAANLQHLRSRKPVFLELDEARALTKAAYDLHLSGREKPAVRVGTLVSAMTADPSADQLIARLAKAARPETSRAFETSRRILSKGYPAEAVNLLIDSDSVSTEEMWLGMEEDIRNRGRRLKPPGPASFALRSAWKSGARQAQVDPPAPSFFFELQGKDVARCNKALWGKAFDLVFRYDLLPADAAASVRGDRLKQVIRGNADLGIAIFPKGLTLTGGASGVARFKDGQMIGDPPRFGLKAPEKGPDVEPWPRGVQVVFTVAGSMIYNFFLEIKLVDVLGTAPCETRVIDLDLEGVVAIKVDEPRIANLFVLSKGDVWEVSGTINGDPIRAELTTMISASKLNAAYGEPALKLFPAIADKAIWRNIDENLDGPAKDRNNAIAEMKSAAAAGSALYQLFSADPVFKNVLEKIEKLPDGSRITFFTNSTVFPWELFYPLDYVDDYPVKNYQPNKFWGYRFVIESLLIAMTEEDKLPAERQQPGKLHVSMGLSNVIDSDPLWAGRTLLPVQLQKDYFDAALKGRGGYFDKYDDIFDTLRRPYPASLIYYFCHGAAGQLEFEKPKSVFMPVHVMGEKYPGWPVIFVNACDAADISPLSFFSFRTKFGAKKAAGLIAPSFKIPTLFAALFAKAFLERYADQQPVGQILFELRRELLAKDNPLGLWYSLQCPLDVRAPEK